MAKKAVFLGGYVGEEVQGYFPNGSYNAATHKMKYIINLLKRSGFFVEVLSYYHTTKTQFIPRRRYTIDSCEAHTYMSVLDIKKGPFKRLSGLHTKLSLFKNLLFLKKGTTLILYNHPLIHSMITVLMPIKKFNLIMDVEECFFALEKDSEKGEVLRKKETAAYNVANGYIVVNDLIPRNHLSGDKPHVVLYGNYTIIPKISEKYDDGKIHVLYSGSIDRMRGCDRAVQAAEFLPANYVMHVTGFGREDQVSYVRDLARRINESAGYDKVVYHGQLPFKDLDRVVQSVHIGLNVQKTDDPFADVSYPSKIAFYLSRGVSVVSSRMASVEASLLGKSVTFYDGESPENIARAILSVEPETYDENIRKLVELDQEAEKKIRILFS